MEYRRLIASGGRAIASTVALLCMAVAMVSCGDGDHLPQGSPSKAPTAAEPDAERSLKVLVGPPGGDQHLVKIYPADSSGDADRINAPNVADAPPVTQSPSLGDPKPGVTLASGPGIRPLATVKNGAGAPIDTNESDAQYGYAKGWTLLLWAARSCTSYDDGAFMLRKQILAPDPTKANQYYIFKSRDSDSLSFDDCDQQLFAQETLLCAADRLAQIADSPGTVTWDSYANSPVDGAGIPSAGTPIRVTVPPQAEDDKFIAMDMAVNALAHVAILDVMRRNVGGSAKTCAEHYFGAATLGTVPPGVFARAPSGPQSSSQYFPPLGLISSHGYGSGGDALAAASGVSRLEYRANLLSASARLLRDLVEHSVHSDLAGAEKKAAAAADPIRGAERRWGAPDIAGSSPYNSLRHALRTLYGRLEIGRNSASPQWSVPANEIDDPRCSRPEGEDGVISSWYMSVGSGAPALNVIDTLGPSHSARWATRPPKTAHESLALSVMDRAGVVLPSTASGANIRLVLQAQVLRDRAVAAGRDYDPFSAPGASDQAAINVLSELVDADFEFANKDLYSALRLLTGKAENYEVVDGDLDSNALYAAAAAAHLPFKQQSEVPEVTSHGGVVLAGGIPRGDLAIDVAAELGPAQKASQCQMYLPQTADGEVDTTVEPGLNPASGATEAMQNAFSLGQTFRRRIAWTRDAVGADAPGNAALARVAKFSNSASAEIGEWAGLTTIVHHYGPTVPPAGLQADLYDVTGIPSESVDSFRKRFVLTVPRADIAQCVAGQRQACPAIPAFSIGKECVNAAGCPTGLVCQSHVCEPGPAESLLYKRPIQVLAPASADTKGLDGIVQRFAFDISLSDSYAVLLPSAPGAGDGEVLAYLRSSGFHLQYFSESVSPLRQQLANEVFGLSRSQQTERTCTDLAPISVSKNYCIDGMKRDMFVPLANELTSNQGGIEASWKHYLDLAEQSAAKADEIGRQLIEQGIQNDLRQEGAVEAVGQLCGSYPNVDDVNISAGKVENTGSDDAINACVNIDTFDLVYLRTDPFEKTARDAKSTADPDGEAAATDLIRSIYCDTESAGRPKFCDKAPTEHISHAGLDFFTGTMVQDETLSEACGDLTSALKPRSSVSGAAPAFNRVPMHAVEQAPWANQEALAATISALKLVELPDRNWILSVGPRPVIATYEGLHQQVFGSGTPSAAQEKEAVKDTAIACDHFNNCSDQAKFISSLFPNPAPNDPFANGLRREVERTVFYLGSLAGRIPDGVITLPLPVANRAVIGDSTPVPAPALYAASRFAKNSSGVSYNNTGDGYHGRLAWSGSDNALMEDLTPLDPELAADRADTGVDWRDELYNQAASLTSGGDPPYLVASTSNTEIAFNPSLLAHPLNDEEASKFGRDTLAQWIEGLAQHYEIDAQDPFVAKSLSAASYYTPNRFFIDKEALKEGRDVCAGAPVSPVFFHTDPTWATNKKYQGTLFVTDTAVNNAENWFSISQMANLAVGSCGTGPQCRTPYDPVFDWVTEAPDGCTTPTRPQWDVWGSGQLIGHTELQMIEGQQAPVRKVVISDPGCANMDWENVRDLDPDHPGLDHADWIIGTRHRITHDRLKPTVCPPNQRVEMFLDTKLEDSTHAMETLVRALGLSCTWANLGTSLSGSLPPPIKTEDDIQQLVTWVGGLARMTTASASTVFVVNVPRLVVAHVKGRGLSIDASAASQGAVGKDELELEEHLRNLERTISNLGTSFNALRGEIQKTQLAIAGAKGEDKARQLEIAARSLENDRMMAIEAGVEAHAAISGAIGVGQAATGALSFAADPKKLAILGAAIAATGGTGAIVVAGLAVAQGLFNMLGAGEEAREEIRRANINLKFGRQIQSNFKEQTVVSGDNKDIQVSLNITNLASNTSGIYQQIQDQLIGIGNSASDAQQSIIDINQGSERARIALAKASGADFVTTESGLVPLHVNTVYRRQFDVLKQRYARSLDSAKRAAYLARLSIEERLGTRLDDLQQDIGPLQAPKLWVDSLCSVQGIDYTKLRTAAATGSNTVGSAGGSSSAASDELDLVKGFADQYIGDYVAKLREFVEFYNVEYPFRDADDTAIISLREDVRNGDRRCLATSVNLLFHSDHLEAAPTVAEEDKGLTKPGSSIGGWRSTACDDVACLLVQNGAGLMNPGPGEGTPLQSPALSGNSTWLHTIEKGTDQGRIGIAQGSVYQTVFLTAGQRYVLSWWDMARGPSGGPYAGSASSAPPEYSVAVYDSQWTLIAVDGRPATPSGSAGTTWSDRNTLQVQPSADGNYHVAFTAAPKGVVGASLAIANVQLELAPGNSQTASAYVSNSLSRSVFSGNCPTDSAEHFRQRFDLVCDSSGDCYHEMRDPLIIDEQLLNQGVSSLISKVGPGNFNYRNNGLALNVVGTGINDCSSSNSPSCNGSAYVLYELSHSARNVHISDYLDKTRCFDFGIASIRGGKALTAERFITLPIGSSDRDLINQPAFMKSEFIGRPISGSYRLRIKDSPTLAWKNVDDVQLVMNYHYWSRVDRGKGL